MTREDLAQLKQEAKQRGAKYLLIGSDNFSYEYYPIFCYSEEEKNREIKKRQFSSGIGDTIKEVITIEQPARAGE